MIKLNTFKKATREEAFNFMLNMRNADYRPTVDEIDLVLNYFAPTAPKASSKMTDIEWVGAACNEKDIRPYCHVIWVQDGEAIGTDGSQMRYCSTDLPNGTYALNAKMLYEVAARRPDFERLKLRFSERDYKTFSLADLPTQLIPNAKKAMWCYAVDDVWIDKTILLGCLRGATSFKAYVCTETNSIQSENFRAMGVRK